MSILPIVERELRLTARKPLTHRVRFGVALGVILLFLLLQLFATRMSSYQVGQLYFALLGSLTLGYCLLAGTFLTADCLSSEKREGTLGLLFLTDLRGFDVVLGKLAATSVQASYAVLAMVPAMALPLLMGGVTFGEFWRLVLVLALALLLSLSLGMLVSALHREARPAMMASAGLMIALAALPYLVWYSLNLGPRARSNIGDEILLLSPVHAYLQSSDAAFRSLTSQAQFWGCIRTLAVLGIASLLMAALILPRIWREGQAEYGTPGRYSWRRLRNWMRWGGTGRKSQLKRMLAWNPMQWLEGRDRLPVMVQTAIIGVLFLVWLANFVFMLQSNNAARSNVAFPLCLILAYAMHQILKGFMAIEASKRLSEDRESGALELLLVTPLSPQTLLRGLRQSMIARFWLPMAMLTLMNLALHWLIGWNNRLKMDDDGRFMLGWLICLGGIALLHIDFSALTWTGMLNGLRRKHHRAVLVTLAKLLVPSWACIGLFLLVGNANGITEAGAYGMIFLWFALGILYGWGLANQSRELLQRHFRSMAAGIEPVTQASCLQVARPSASAARQSAASARRRPASRNA